MNVEILNKLPRDIFAYKSNNNQQIKVCNASGETVRTLDRDKLISMGRMATCEYFGKMGANDKNSVGKYNSRLKDVDYETFSRNVWESTVLFCAAQANKQIGKAPYPSMKEVEEDTSLYTNSTFWATLAAISTEVVSPLLPEIADAVTNRLISWTNGRLGETKMIEIKSNDFFVYDDDSWGSVSSKPTQRLYKASVAVTPKLYTARAKIYWYQDVVDGDAGSYYAAFARGAVNKMFAITVSKFKAAIENTKYMPTGYKLDGFSMENWNKALMRSAALNGVSRNQLMALGDLEALSNVLPTAGDGSLAGFGGDIGTEWARSGYLATVSGVDLMEVGLAVVPGTQNYDPKFIGLEEAIYILAKVGSAPMAGVKTANPISVTLEPVRGTADMSIDITETIAFDIAPVFSNKIYKISVK